MIRAQLTLSCLDRIATIRAICAKDWADTLPFLVSAIEDFVELFRHGQACHPRTRSRAIARQGADCALAASHVFGHFVDVLRRLRR